MVLKSRNILIRSDGYEDKNNFSIFLEYPIKNVRRMSIINCAIVNSSYNIQNNLSDKLYIYREGESESSASVITINEGNYSVSQLVSTLQNTLNSNITLGSSSWSVSYNSITYKVTISSNINFHISSIRGQQLLYNLGFNNVSGDPKKIYVSQDVIRLNPPRNILLKFDNIPYGSLDIPNSNNSAHFIIPQYSQSGSITFLNKNDMEGQNVSFYENGVDIDRLSVKLLAPDNNRSLYSIYSDWSLLLKVEYLD